MHDGLEATIPSEVLGVSVRLADVYEGVEFDPLRPSEGDVSAAE